MRKYNEVKTNNVFYVCRDNTTHELFLLDKDYKKVNRPFYACGFTGTQLKLKNGEIVNLGIGELYFIDLKNKPTGKKFFMQKKFYNYE